MANDLADQVYDNVRRMFPGAAVPPPQRLYDEFDPNAPNGVPNFAEASQRFSAITFDVVSTAGPKCDLWGERGPISTAVRLAIGPAWKIETYIGEEADETHVKIWRREMDFSFSSDEFHEFCTKLLGRRRPAPRAFTLPQVHAFDHLAHVPRGAGLPHWFK